MAGRLARYREKRDFEATPEPSSGARPRGLVLHYSMQCHDGPICGSVGSLVHL